MEKEIKELTKRKKLPSRSKLSASEFLALDIKRILNQECPPSLLKKNKQYNNKYIPLEVVEQMLHAIFKHHEVVVPFMPQYVEGQMLWIVNVIVHHEDGTKLTYSGNSCVPIIGPDKENMKYNHRNIPAGEGFAIMNAAKKIGRIFRAEHDDQSNVMAPYFEKKVEAVESPEYDRVRRMIEKRITLNTSQYLDYLRIIKDAGLTNEQGDYLQTILEQKLKQ